MTRLALKWRLEGGYSRFLDGSAVEMRMAESPMAAAVGLHPAALFRKREPVELLFTLGRSYSGKAGPGLRWRLNPESRVRAVLLFAGNAFLGNFRVPSGCFAVQWEIEANATASLTKDAAPFLVGLRGGTKLCQSWVSVFPNKHGLASAFEEAWLGYRDPFDSSEALRLDDNQVVRWKWDGHAQLEMDFSWAVGAGWAIPGKVPLVDLHKELTALAGLGAVFTAREEGQFSLQLRKRDGRLEFQLKRALSRRRASSVSVGVQLRNPVKLGQIGLKKPAAAKIASEALGQPLVSRLNRACEASLARRLAIALSASGEGWRTQSRLVEAVWRAPNPNEFEPAYGELLKCRVPSSTPDLKVTGRFESIRGRRISMSFFLLDWIKLRRATERQVQNVVTVGPGGELAVERIESFEKTSYRWDELQLLKLAHREATGADQPLEWDFWTWGVEDEMSQERLEQLLHMALHCGVIREFSMPARSAFPLEARLTLGTRFSRQGLDAVRLAGADQKWKALVRSLELVEPDRYGVESFWRDWLDSPELRESVDQNPAQSDLETLYPVPGRTQVERTLVVTAYRRARRFLAFLEMWTKRPDRHALDAFETGMDVPIFVFFHLLCPPKLRRSAATLTGGVEQTWGDLGLFEAR